MTWMPGTLVAIGLKTLRTLSGTFSLGSQRSRWLGPALEIDHDDALGLAPAGAAAGLAGPGRGRLELEHRAQAHAQQARAATRRMSRRVTPSCGSHRSFPGLSGYDDHRVAPWYRSSSVQFIRTIRATARAVQTNIVSCRQAIVPSKIGILRTGTGTYVQDTFEGFPAPVALGLDRRGSLSNRRAKNRFNPRQQSSVAK